MSAQQPPSGNHSVEASSAVHKLFLDDQAARQRPLSRDEAVWLNNQDAERRIVIRKLLEGGSLKTGQDFEEAAFVFQHGLSADDYLLAHTLAMIAMSKGRASALWIATATLDRYLTKIGQSQIFGTQTHKTPTTPWTQEPYDRNLISDGLLSALGVDLRREQQKRVEALNAAK